MKRIFIALVVAGAFTTVANAQQAVTVAPAQEAKPQMSKEEKAKQKQKIEDDLAAAFKEAGLTDAEIKQAKEVMETARVKRNEIKKNATLSEEEKTKQTQVVKDEEKTKLIEIMGSKYKAYKEAQKKQKAAAPAM